MSDFTPLRGAGVRGSVVPGGDGNAAVSGDRETKPRHCGILRRTLEIGLRRRPSSHRRGRAERVAAVAVVNRRIAVGCSPGQDGRLTPFRLVPTNVPPKSYTVIGVSNNISNWDVGNRPLPTAYSPFPEASRRQASGERPRDRGSEAVDSAGARDRCIQLTHSTAAGAGADGGGDPETRSPARRRWPMLLRSLTLYRSMLTAVGLYSVLSSLVVAATPGALESGGSQRRRET